MKNNEYLTIAEFAKRAGVTKQAVYLRLNKDLKPYLKEIEGKKCLKNEALELFGVKPLEQALVQDPSSTLIDLAAYLEGQNKRYDRLIDVLEADNAKLHGELDIKNKQLLESNERQRELSIMLDQQQKLNAQALLTGSQRDPDPSSVDHQEEIGAAYDQGYQKGQADTREQLQAEIDEVRKKGRHEALTQYDLGYQKGKKEQQEQMSEIAKALYRKYPEAADYLIELFSK